MHRYFARATESLNSIEVGTAMREERQPIERLEGLMHRLLAEVKPEDLKRMQTQYDELESRVTQEELNRMARLLRSVVSVENLRKSSKR